MSEKKEEKLEAVQEQNQQIQEFGEAMLEDNEKKYHIQLLSIIGEVEGHECLPNNSKTTKYEHVIPQLVAVEEDDSVDGLLILINTVGGDVEAGLGIAEYEVERYKSECRFLLKALYKIPAFIRNIFLGRDIQASLDRKKYN